MRALVVGCTGVAGSALVSRLIHDAERAHTQWEEIVGLSRGPHTNMEVKKRSKKSVFTVRFIGADLTENDAEKLSNAIGKDLLLRITHIFFCAWLPFPQSNEEEFTKNCAIFSNLVETVATVHNNNASKYPRFILLEGTKTYGIHLGPLKFSDYKAPFVESDYKRHGVLKNFYFGWEDLLLEKKWPEWVAVRPGPIVGVAVQRSSFFNFGTGLACLLALLKATGKGMIFPDSLDGTPKVKALSALHDQVHSDIVAAEMVFLALAPSEKLDKQMLDSYGVHGFNCSNGEPFQWKNVWPQLASKFNMNCSLDEPFNLVDFLKDEKTNAAWAKLVDEHELVTPRNLSEVVVWPAVIGTLTRSYDCHASVEKVRKLGFSTTMNTVDMFIQVIKQLQKEKVIPPILIQ